MPADSQMIRPESFNAKFKTYLRDFYTYQFKEKGEHFYSRKPSNNGSSPYSKVDSKVKTATFFADAYRLKAVIEHAAGVEWSFTGNITQSDRVECVTIDTRQIDVNPFLRLYRFCGERSNVPGQHFAFLYALLFIFHQGETIRKVDIQLPSEQDWDDLWKYLRYAIVDIEADRRKGNPDSDENVFSHPDVVHYAKAALEQFKKNTDDFQIIKEYLIASGQDIAFADGKFYITKRTEPLSIEKNMLLHLVNQFVNLEDRMFRYKMNELQQLGIIDVDVLAGQTYYSLSKNNLSSAAGEEPDFIVRFRDMVTFFSNTSPLGAIGTYLLYRLPRSDCFTIKYKHNYLQRVLCDYNLIDLLYALRFQKALVVEYRNATVDKMEHLEIVCLPLEIRESVTDGRQHLIFYHPILRSVSALRVDFIDSISLVSLEAPPSYLSEDLERARALIAGTWGTGFSDYHSGNVKVMPNLKTITILIEWDPEENFILERLRREIRGKGHIEKAKIKGHDSCLQVIAHVVNPNDMLQWLRSYTTRVISVIIDNEEASQFKKGVKRAYDSYYFPFRQVDPVMKQENELFITPQNASVKKTKDSSYHSAIFNEVFSESFFQLGVLLSNLMEKKVLTPREQNSLISEYQRAFYSQANYDAQTDEKRRKQAYNLIQCFSQRNNDGQTSKPFFLFNDNSKPESLYNLLPLTSIEIQWLRCVLTSPLVNAFLSKSEINRLLDTLPNPDLFDLADVNLHDQFLGQDAFFQSDSFGIYAKTILHAIRTRKKLQLSYCSQYGNHLNTVCSPAFLEYSKRDNRFRLYAVSSEGKVNIFTLDRIQSVILDNSSFDASDVLHSVEVKRKANEKRLEIVFREDENIPDRILNEFSCFKKKCVKWGNRQYRMTLYYDVEDTREIVVRLLSYGSKIFVFDDTGDVRHQMIKRIEHQMDLMPELDKAPPVIVREEER